MNMARSTRPSRSRARRGLKPDEGPPPTWSERLAALKHVPPLIRLVFQTHRGYTAAILALRVIRSFIPAAVLWFGNLIIDGVLAGMAPSHPGRTPHSLHSATLLCTVL